MVDSEDQIDWTAEWEPLDCDETFFVGLSEHGPYGDDAYGMLRSICDFRLASVQRCYSVEKSSEGRGSGSRIVGPHKTLREITLRAGIG